MVIYSASTRDSESTLSSLQLTLNKAAEIRHQISERHLKQTKRKH